MSSIEYSLNHILNADLPPLSQLQDPAYRPAGNSLAAASPEELEATLVCAVKALHGYSAAEQNQAGIASVVTHEVQHAQAARAVGGVALDYGVHFFAGGRHGICYFAYHMSTLTGDPLLDAAVELYPNKPSWHDIRAGQRLGYDVNQLALQAIRHNARHSLQIPLPLSYRPGQSKPLTVPTRYSERFHTYGRQ